MVSVVEVEAVVGDAIGGQGGICGRNCSSGRRCNRWSRWYLW